VQPLVAQGFLLGIMPGEQYREREVVLEPGDRLCFYTDGLVDGRNEIGETFGTERLRTCLTAHGRDPAELIATHMIDCQCGFRGDQPLGDDVTLVVGELAAP
jgi:sigma-B regulation protein RsbU (phosphoserine phosphatase)